MWCFAADFGVGVFVIYMWMNAMMVSGDYVDIIGIFYRNVY